MSDFKSPAMAEFLVELGIDAISLDPDAVLAITRCVLAVESRLGRPPRNEPDNPLPSDKAKMKSSP